MLIIGKISKTQFFVYVIAQFCGAFLGAFAVYLTYLESIYNYEEVLSLKTASIFSTFPNEKVGSLNLCFDQAFVTSLLLIIILALTDKNNEDLSHSAIASFLGITITIIGISFGYNCGYPINPARDLAPRIFSYLAGWGTEVFSAGNYYFWIPVVMPMIGSVLGTLIYRVLISNHWSHDIKL